VNELKNNQKETCDWQFDGEHHITDCNHAFYFDDCSYVEDSQFVYCPYCGKKINAICLDTMNLLSDNEEVKDE